MPPTRALVGVIFVVSGLLVSQPARSGTADPARSTETPPTPAPAAAAPERARFSRPPTPNPGRGPVSLAIALPRPANVTVTIHDLSGRLLAVVARESLAAGEHVLRWDGRTRSGERASVGLYIVMLRADGVAAAQRLCLLR